MKIGLLGQEKAIPRPKELKITYQEISKSDRTASGRRVTDVVARKKIFNITYNGLLPEDMKFLTELYTKNEDVNFIYEDENGTQKVLVDITALPRDIYTPKPQYSKNINITLEEI